MKRIVITAGQGACRQARVKTEEGPDGTTWLALGQQRAKQSNGRMHMQLKAAL